MNRIILAGAAGIVAVGAVSASAASLGGINSEGVGVDNAVVASCDTDGITVDYTVGYTSSLASYRVKTVDLSDVADACDGLDYSLTLSTDDSTSVFDDTGVVTLSGNAMSIDVSASNVNGESVDGIALAILGRPTP